MSKRLASFKKWPKELRIKPEELAEAGFYHQPEGQAADAVNKAIAVNTIITKHVSSD